jgi:hypothetical protein
LVQEELLQEDSRNNRCNHKVIPSISLSHLPPSLPPSLPPIFPLADVFPFLLLSDPIPQEILNLVEKAEVLSNNWERFPNPTRQSCTAELSKLRGEHIKDEGVS